MKGVVADNMYVMLDGATAVSDIAHYEQTIKDEKGIKRKYKHVFFNVLFDCGSVIRFERDRDKLPLNKHRDFSDPNTVIVYTNKTMADARLEVIEKIFK